ncbi:MAG: metallophosphoesterase family protein [Flavobacteriales bacterium]
MNRVLKNALRFQIQSDSAKLIVFSDHHRGLGDGADDFVNCEQVYLDALDYYYMNGYTLILLGDVEEFWECVPLLVMRKYKQVLEKEALFHKEGRLIKIWGNHDDQWQEGLFKSATLPSIFKGLKVYEGIVIELKESSSQKKIELVMIHGHQGTLSGDKLARISRWFVRWFWRPIQQIFKIKLNATPSTDIELRSTHDKDMYAWSKSRGNTMLFCGHTHQPVFMSNTHLDELLAKRESDSCKELEDEIAEVKKVSTELKVDDKIPCYFNSGCCSFDNGAITGLEIIEEKIQLIKWKAGEDKTVKREESLSKLFELLG